MIAEQRNILLDRLGHEAVGFQLAVERKLQVLRDSDISWRWETAETGFFRALRGKRRDVLVISHARLREYAVLIGCRTHGTALSVSWSILVTPRIANDLRRAVRFGVEAGSRFEVGAELDAFDVADLRAFVNATRLALNHAVRELTNRENDTIGEPTLKSLESE